MKEVTVDATLESVDVIQGIIEEELENAEASMKAMMTISIAVEEIYVNIAHYAYTPEVGKATVRYELQEENGIKRAVIQFIDSGVPYNPLAKEDTDTTLSVEERSIGGLGILMVKKSMDDVRYEYKDGHNIFTMEKEI